MRRRSLLAAGLAVPIAGCTDALSRDSAWRELVMDAPEGVYVPQKRDGTTTYALEPVGDRGDGDLAVAVMATRPHSFLTVTGTETSWVGPRSEDAIHLMVSVWHRPTGRVVPAPVSVAVDDGPGHTLWPMLSQRMGVHAGDNVSLPGDGRYALDVEIGAPPVRLLDGLDGALADGASVETRIEFEEREIEALERTLIDSSRRGEPGALAPMDHGGDDTDEDDAGGDTGGDGLTGPPVSRTPRVEDVPGTVLGTARLDGASLVVTVLDRDEPSLAVSPRTPHNRYPLPGASLAADLGTGGSEPLEPAIDASLGYHYGRTLEELPGELRVTVEAPPQVARHFGYETAFLEGGEAVLEG